jgi:glycosyltransferase involved in cell wall biosynthesis
MSFPKVSIQIPIYNQAKYIEQAVKSCLAQDYPNFEINIADDCSTDNSYEIIKSYLADSKVKYFKNETNIGRVANYRKALYEYATGEWALNLDGDDYFTNKDYIKTAIEFICIEGYKDVLFYQGAHIFKTPRKEYLIEANIKADTVVMSAKDYLLNLFTISHFSHMSSLYNRHTAMNLGFYDKDIISADIYSFLKLAVNEPEKKVILSATASGVWLQHKKNTSKSLKINQHIKNFNLYVIIFLQQLKITGFSKLASGIWFSKAVFYYWAWYLKKNTLG